MAVWREADLPAVVVDLAVVVAAQENRIGQRSGAALGPVAQVVALAPARWPVAAGEGAPSVTEDECAA